jgi:uncharacterized protein YndB with AHSA1/START domain
MTEHPNTETPTPPFEITRQFKASRARVWAAWTQPAQLEKWWGPKGCTLKVCRLDFRPGGFFHYQMTFSAGQPLWGRFMYSEIVEPEKIVYLSSFSNAECGIARAPFALAFPFEINNTLTFSETAGATLLSLRCHPHGATEEETKVFADMSQSMQTGYGSTMTALAEHLAQT